MQQPADGTAAHGGAHGGATRSLGSRLRAFARGRLALFAVLLLLVPLVLAGALRGLVVQPFTVPTASMEPALMPGDTVRAWRWDALAGSVERGDVVVVDGRGSFIGSLPPDVFQQTGAWFGLGPRDVYFVKRVIGVGGDTVQCCDADGALLVNGAPLDEPYLPEPERASDASFAVEVPADRLWLMGDNRRNSFDSRDLLGRPGGGMVRTERVVGTVRLSSADRG